MCIYSQIMSHYIPCNQIQTLRENAQRGSSYTDACVSAMGWLTKECLLWYAEISRRFQLYDTSEGK